jgi:hypothetical protein
LRIAGAKAASVMATPATFTSSSRRRCSTSRRSSPLVPAETPALAITRSGKPKSFAVAAIARASVTSAEYALPFIDPISMGRREIKPRTAS